MKREILFRGISKEKNVFVFGFYNTIQDKERYIFEPCVLGLLHTEVDLETVGQFTGTTDKNGVNIFEGDILQIESEKLMIVSWSQKFASFVLNREGWAFSHWFGESCNPENCSVIGNIHESPELLK